jgi:hypothetical protein
MERLRNALVKRSTHLTGTGGDAVDEVFHHVRHERRRVVGILRSGQRKLVLAIAELRAPEWNERVLDERLATAALAKENIDATFDGLLRDGCVNTGEQRERSKEAVGVHVEEFRVDDGDNMVYDKPTPESVSKLCGRGQ